MRSLDSRRLRDLVRQVLDGQVSSGAGSGPSGAAAAARRTYGALADVTAPLIGHNGLTALTDRALHLARRRHPWLLDAAGPPSEEPFETAMSRAERQTPAEAADGAVEVVAILCGLLVSLIGEGLTRHLLHTAWAVVLPADTGEEKEPQ